MNAMRMVYHLARADFLERVRRYGFLITLGLVLLLGYSIASGQLVLVTGQQYRGVINSAWVGGLMAYMINVFLGFLGFYLVKGSINRDYETGVGQIMATTPLKRPVYTLGKWLSNFAVLGVIVAILAVVALVMQLVYREDPVINLWALLSPLLLLTLPYMAFTAALAVLVETIPSLRGGLGNVVYFFLFIMVIIMLSIPGVAAIDLIGMSILSKSMGQAAIAVFPAYNGSFMISWFDTDFQTYLWNGVDWTSGLVIWRVILFLVSIGIAAFAGNFFDRFNPSRLRPVRRRKTAAGLPGAAPASEQPALPEVRLTPLSTTHMRFSFVSLFFAELKIFLKGQRWWWYVIAAGLIIAQFFTPIEYSRMLLIIAWVWEILLLSRLGCREKVLDTRQIVFSAPHPVAAQLPAMWLSAFTVTALLGLGAIIKFVIMGETFSILGWLVGLFFIPSAALAFGVLTGSSKAFEVLYVIWMYMIFREMTPFDFLGMTPGSPLLVYALIAVVLLVLAVFARQRQIRSGGTSR